MLETAVVLLFLGAEGGPGARMLNEGGFAYTPPEAQQCAMPLQMLKAQKEMRSPDQQWIEIHRTEFRNFVLARVCRLRRL